LEANFTYIFRLILHTYTNQCDIENTRTCQERYSLINVLVASD